MLAARVFVFTMPAAGPMCPLKADPSVRMQNTKERPTNASAGAGALPAPPRDLVRDLAAAARRAACFALGGISGGGNAGRTD